MFLLNNIVCVTSESHCRVRILDLFPTSEVVFVGWKEISKIGMKWVPNRGLTYRARLFGWGTYESHHGWLSFFPRSTNGFDISSCRSKILPFAPEVVHCTLYRSCEWNIFFCVALVNFNFCFVLFCGFCRSIRSWGFLFLHQFRNSWV